MNRELLGLSIDSVLSHLAWTRNIQEKCAIETPEDWPSGCGVIVPPPKTAEAVAKRREEGFHTVDWYHSTESPK